MAKEIPIIIKVDGKEVDLAKTSINDFQKIYSDAQKKLQSLPLGSDEWKKLNSEVKNADKTFQQTKEIMSETEGKFKSLKVQIRQATVAFQEAEEKGDLAGMKKAKKQLDELNDQFELTTLKAMKFEDALATMPGIAGFVGQSIQGVDKAFKVLVANPLLAVVTALVGAFTFLKEALSKTSEGQAALNKVSDAFSSVMAPLLALINTVAVPIFEKLANIIGAVGKAFTWFAEKLGVSSSSIKQAKTDLQGLTDEAKKAQDDINGYIAKGNEAKMSERNKELNAAKKDYEEKIKLAKQFGLDESAITDSYNKQRSEINKKYNEKDAEVRKQKNADDKKSKQDAINDNEALEQSETELARAKVQASTDEIQAIKDKQAQQDEDYQRESKRIDDLMKLEKKDSAEYKKLQIEKNNLDKDYLKNKAENTKGITKLNQDKIDNEKEFNNKISELQISLIKDEKDREIASIQDKLKRDLENLEKDKAFIEKKEKEKERIRQLYRDQAAQAEQKVVENSQKRTEQENLKKLDDDLKFLQIKQGAMVQGTKAFYDIQREIQKKAEEREIADLKASDEFKKKSKEEQEAIITAIQQKGANDRKAINMQEILAYAEMTSKVIGIGTQITAALGAIFENQMNRELKAAGANQEEQEKIKKKYFEKNKKLQIANAYIQMFQSAISAFSSMAAIPVVGPALGAVAAAAAIALGIANINKIKSQEYESPASAGNSTAGVAAPQPNLGKNYEKGGMIGGKRHAQGGTLIEAEQGEAIMTRGAVTMFAPLLSAMNQMGGGTSFVKSAMTTSNDAAKTSNPSADASPIIVKSYVVSSDMTSTQEKQARLKDLSTL